MQGIWRSVSEKQNYNQYNDLISNWSAQNLFSTCLDLTKKKQRNKMQMQKTKTNLRAGIHFKDLCGTDV